MTLTDFDRRLLEELQNDFPLTERPFAVIAKKIGSDEQTVIRRVSELRNTGLIRRFGAFFASDKLGYTGQLVAVKVEPEQLKSAAEFINTSNGVTHNYERTGEYNLWFTLQTTTKEESINFLNQVRNLSGVSKVEVLPVEKKYKISVRLPLNKRI